MFVSAATDGTEKSTIVHCRRCLLTQWPTLEPDVANTMIHASCLCYMSTTIGTMITQSPLRCQPSLIGAFLYAQIYI